MGQWNITQILRVSVSALMLSGLGMVQAQGKAPAFPNVLLKNNQVLVFPDVQQAQWKITYDGKKKEVRYDGILTYQLNRPGLIAFDAVVEPAKISLVSSARSGESEVVLTQLVLQLPKDAQPSTDPDVLANPSMNARDVLSTYRSITLGGQEQIFSPGTYQIRFQGTVKALVAWELVKTGVSSAFWTSDLDQRSFLEKYLPASFEYDQYASTYEIEFQGMDLEQQVQTNAKVVKVQAYNKNKKLQKVWLQTPKTFNAASLFFHTYPLGKFKVEKGTYGPKSLPITVYGSQSAVELKATIEQVKKDLQELEQKFGPFAHPQVLVYLAGSGGMEYAGATMTEKWALSHELCHSYFARGIMPANGNAGWFDEAVASWRDEGYRTNSTGQFSPERAPIALAAHHPFTRITDDSAYSYGEELIRYWDQQIKAQTKGESSMLALLKELFTAQKFVPYTNADLIQWMNGVVPEIAWKDQFEQFAFKSASTSSIFGGVLKSLPSNDDHQDEPAIIPATLKRSKHQKMSDRELEQLL